jgi:LysM repeat protein
MATNEQLISYYQKVLANPGAGDDVKTQATQALKGLQPTVTTSTSTTTPTPTPITTPPITNPTPTTPIQQTTGGSYTIQGGDTLSALAARNKTTVAALMAANPQITNPNLIYTGANLNIPGAGSTIVPGSTTGATDTEQARAAAQAVKDKEAKDKADALKKASDDLLSANTEAQKLAAQKAIQDLKASMGIGTPPPPTTYESDLEALKAKEGTTALQTQINSVNAETAALEASYKAGKAAISNELAPMDLLTTRQRELADQYNQQLDNLNNRKKVLVDEYNLKVSNINAIMDAKKMDYDSAKDAYDTSFNQAINLMTIMNTMENTKADNARANLTATMSMLQTVDPSLITPEMRASLNLMDAQAGNTVGISQFVLDNATDPILGNGQVENADGTKSLYVMYKGKDGVPYTSIVGTVGSGDGSGPSGYKETGFGSRVQFALDQNLTPQDAAWEVWTNFVQDSGTKVTYAQLLAEANALYNKKNTAGNGGNMTTWDVPQYTPQASQQSTTQPGMTSTAWQGTKDFFGGVSSNISSYIEGMKGTPESIENAPATKVTNWIKNLFGGK